MTHVVSTEVSLYLLSSSSVMKLSSAGRVDGRGRASTFSTTAMWMALLGRFGLGGSEQENTQKTTSCTVTEIAFLSDHKRLAHRSGTVMYSYTENKPFVMSCYNIACVVADTPPILVHKIKCFKLPFKLVHAN